VTRVIHGHDGILDVVQNGLQVRRRLLTDLTREGLRLIGHELHGAHDAAPLRIEAIVMRADGGQQRTQVHLTVAIAGFGKLQLQQAIKALRFLRGCAANRDRIIA
jgi:hypothetical protein